jgi:hypothetical protein
MSERKAWKDNMVEPKEDTENTVPETSEATDDATPESLAEHDAELRDASKAQMQEAAERVEQS